MQTEAKRTQGPIWIFGFQRETILLLLPLVIIFLAWAENFLDWNPGHNIREDLSILVNVVFLSSLHNIFTFQLAFTNPTYFRLITENRGKWGKAILLLMAGIFLFLEMARVLSSEVFSSVVFGLLTTFIYFHTARQFLGLSLIYNQQARRSRNLSEGELGQLSQAEAFEHRGVRVHVGAMALQSFLVIFYEYRGEDFPMWVRHIFVASGALLIAAMIYKYSKLDRGMFRNKMIFMLRYLMMLISFYSFWAFLGTKLVHGIEYFIIYRRIQSHQKKSGERSPIALYVLTYVLAFVVIASNFTGASLAFGFDPKGIWSKILLIGAGSLVWLHYYLDGLLFAMRREEVRRQTGHWLLHDAS